MTSSNETRRSQISTSNNPVKGFSLPSKLTSTKSPKPKPKPVSFLGKRPRSSFARDDGSSSEDEASQKNMHELVVGFGDGGAIGLEEHQSRAPLVIKRLKNRDWKAEIRSRRGKNLLPPEVLAAQREKTEERSVQDKDAEDDSPTAGQWGLTIGHSGSHLKTVPTQPAHKENLGSEAKNCDNANPVADVALAGVRNLDEEALQALLGQKDEVKGPDLVIPARDMSTTRELMSEDDVYKRAVAAAPEPSSLEDYEQVPVEEFGAALLRGMGWNGEKVGATREVKRRQNLLGLGAKELKEAEYLGAWVNKSDTKKLKSSTNGRSDWKSKSNGFRSI